MLRFGYAYDGACGLTLRVGYTYDPPVRRCSYDFDVPLCGRSESHMVAVYDYDSNATTWLDLLATGGTFEGWAGLVTRETDPAYPLLTEIKP